jgi:hypothetical protein
MIDRMYRRRRVGAVATCLVAVVLLAWIIGRLVSGTEQTPARGAAAQTSQPPSTRPAGGPASSSASSSPSAGPGATGPSPSSATVPPPSSAAPPLPPPTCPDAAITVSAETGAPGYRVGERPLLRLVVANAGQVACIREVSRGLRELVISSADGKQRLWSSNDCYGPPGVDSRLLQPGERLSFTLNWFGRTSSEGCPSRRRTLPAGSYLVTARLGTLTSAPVPLTLS